MTKWLQTYGGSAYDLDRDPDPCSIVLGDIAFALAHLNRFTGHAGTYSVAQHSVLAARVARAQGHSDFVQRAALMHDAHEAYTGDIASPIKRVLGDAWRSFERRHEIAVRRRFAIGVSLPAAVVNIDLRLLITERRDLLGDVQARPWAIDPEPYTAREGLAKILPWGPAEAERCFLSEAERLWIR